jgi:hypothetical protein
MGAFVVFSVWGVVGSPVGISDGDEVVGEYNRNFKKLDI